ncbi:hypothetical protein JOM56_002732 [Amanita muscaria]
MWLCRCYFTALKIMPSTAQSLPDDVIREILKTFAAPLLILIDGSAQEFPWYLSHVCSSWRVAFLSMHQDFWNKFLLYPAIFWTYESELQCTDIAAAFIEHSNGKPFSFEIHRNSRSRLVLDTFFREATCWQDVSFAIEEEEIPILESTRGRLSQLHSLTLVVTSADWAVEDLRQSNYITKVPQSCSGIFTDAPRLTHVKLSDLSTWQFNWSSLTSLELIKPVNNPYLLQALPHMQSLERLLVNQPDNAHYNYIGTGPISLLRLRVLTIFGFGLLPILVSPSLNELYMDVEPYNYGWETAPAVCASFFQRSSCTIQRLGLRMMSMTEQILRLTPDLYFLSIHVDDRWPLDLLVPMRSGQLLLVPGVQSLRITSSTRFQNPPAALLTLISSRTAESIPLESRLKELTIALEDSTDLEDIRLLQGVGLHCRKWSSAIQFRIVSPVGPDSDLGRISGEVKSLEPVKILTQQYQ